MKTGSYIRTPLYEEEVQSLEESREKGLKEGIQKGKLEGLKEGEQKGMGKGVEKGKIEIARNLLKKGMDVADIQEITGLPLETIEDLSK